jgi:hypothetical protein
MFFAFKRDEWHLSVTQPSPIAAFVTKVARPTDAPKKRTITSARRLCIIFSLTKERFKNQKNTDCQKDPPGGIVSAGIFLLTALSMEIIITRFILILLILLNNN